MPRLILTKKRMMGGTRGAKVTLCFPSVSKNVSGSNLGTVAGCQSAWVPYVGKKKKTYA